jgi:alpha-L-glutamate ligase-like protein
LLNDPAFLPYGRFVGYPAIQFSIIPILRFWSPIIPTFQFPGFNMIFKSLRWLQDMGILGMNRRNATYIMGSNPRSSFPLVDDKLLTKQIAAKYGVPTPSLYQTIRYHGEIDRLEKSLAASDGFVIKPARGAGGSGIILITGENEGGFVTQSGEIISWGALTSHLSDVLSGVYSLGGSEDCALIEALVKPDPIFSAVTFRGVPDIRIVVYRGVPVMGMVRLPTRASDGKANLHRGAIGVGIDMKTGKTLSGVHKFQVITHHPDTGNPVEGIEVPFWKEMLLIAASTLEMTGLGYLGVDMVIDDQRGPLLLELNARPGLQIQIANRVGLRGRLELSEKAPPGMIATPEQRTEWAREAFRASMA